jgi:alpha-L-fucosidase
MKSSGLRKIAFAFLTVFIITTQVNAQAPYKPSAENMEARRWYQDAKFGLFIHWGIYSVPGGEWKGQIVHGNSEWIMQTAKIPIAEYEPIAAEFNPTKFNPAEWVALAKAAGMKYITITSKHHDGFAMWDSKVSDWDIVDRTPYKKDVLQMLADECHRQGIKLFFYHSQLDWHHPDYYPRGLTGEHAGRPESGGFSKYLDYMDAELTELLGGKFGKIGGIWFDGWWDQQIKEPGKPVTATKVDWRLRRTYDLIHRLQPQALIGNNHHVTPFEGEDFQMFEKDLPGQNTAGFNADATISNLPLEACDTTNDSWGYKKSDHKFKSLKQLVDMLVSSAGHNANFLLNIGPMPTGEFPPEAIAQLKQLGAWIAEYGDSIYGTRGGPVAPQKWGVTTQKGSKVYVHITDATATAGEEIFLPELKGRVKSAKLMKDGSVLPFDAKISSLTVPRLSRDPVDTVLVLEVDGR